MKRDVRRVEARFSQGFGSCEDATKSLVHELEGRFPNHDLMLALSVICPNFWVDHPMMLKMFSISI